MIRTGLVSITFRSLTVEEIVPLSVQAGIQGIEWGGDIHVPHGDIKRALEVAHLTKESGLHVAAYGSYYKIGTTNAGISSYESVIETAAALGALTVRVWAADIGSESADEVLWNKVVIETRLMADLAEKAGIRISFEYHGNTLTDTISSTLKLLHAINHTNVFSYWQPAVGLDVHTRLHDLALLIPKLDHIHVFQWQEKTRLPLAEGLDEWIPYLQLAQQAQGDRYVMLEFVKNDDPQQFLEDARTLHNLVGGLPC